MLDGTTMHDVPMTSQLRSQHVHDLLDAGEEESEARRYEAEARYVPEEKRRMSMGRWLRMCSRSALYCPHNPACPR